LQIKINDREEKWGLRMLWIKKRIVMSISLFSYIQLSEPQQTPKCFLKFEKWFHNLFKAEISKNSY